MNINASKKLLILTDLSAGTLCVAEYGYRLASALGFNVVLCNAITIPSDVPQAELSVWPVEETALLFKDSSLGLEALRKNLEALKISPDFKPQIEISTESGSLVDVVTQATSTTDFELIIMGSSSGAMSHFFLDNHTERMIERSSKPLLIVQPSVRYATIKKIAFASDFEDPKNDFRCLSILALFARKLNAQIVLAHINLKAAKQKDEQWVNDFMRTASLKTSYSSFSLTFIDKESIEEGLEQLLRKEEYQMLTMEHRSRSFFSKIFQRSHTQYAAGHIDIPLLVFQTLPKNADRTLQLEGIGY